MSVEGLVVGVTGGAGFIGSHLVERIVQDGPARVVVLDDLSTGTADNLAGVAGAVDLIEGDVREQGAARSIADADIVFHLAVRNVRASIGRPVENFDVNAMGTISILEAMRDGRRGAFVYVSSSEVYGVPPDGEYREDRLTAPTTAYGAGKLAGEHITAAYGITYGMDTRTIRPFNNYGPRSHFEGDSGEVIPKFILRALAGRSLVIHGDGTQSRDFMFVRDTADWLVRLATISALRGDVVNIGSGVDQSINDLAHTVLTSIGGDADVTYSDPRPGDLPRLCADTSKIRRFVDFSLATSFEDGLNETIEYFRSFDPEALLDREQEQPWK